ILARCNASCVGSAIIAAQSTAFLLRTSATPLPCCRRTTPCALRARSQIPSDAPCVYLEQQPTAGITSPEAERVLAAWRFPARAGRLARIDLLTSCSGRSEERRVGKECRSRWSPY